MFCFLIHLENHREESAATPAQLLVLLLQAALYVQQVVDFLLELLLGGPQRTELLVLGLQVVVDQVALLRLLLDLQRQVLHLEEEEEERQRDEERSVL